jgi:hypothetical protein
MKRTLAIASVAGSLCSAAMAQVVMPPTQPMPSVGAMPSVKPVEIKPDEKQDAELQSILGRSGAAFDGVLVNKKTILPQGMRVLMTQYTFQVHEWFKNPQASGLITITELGGEAEDGSAVSRWSRTNSCRAGATWCSWRPRPVPCSRSTGFST